MLTYKEFEARVKELDSDFKVMRTSFDCRVSHKEFSSVVVISKICIFELDTMRAGMPLIANKEQLFELAIELAATPIDKRVEEQRWHMKSKWLIDEVYLFNKCAGSDAKPMLRHVYLKNATAFTRSEIETLRVCFGDIVNHYAEVEVTEC